MKKVNTLHYENLGAKKTRANIRKWLKAQKEKYHSVPIETVLDWLNAMPKRQNKKAGGLGKKNVS